jgi:hypothetical protein
VVNRAAALLEDSALAFASALPSGLFCSRAAFSYLFHRLGIRSSPLPTHGGV